MKSVSKGFMAILTVITLLAFSVSLIGAVTYLSIDGSQMGLALSQGTESLAFMEGCAEDALLLSSRDENYLGGTYEYLDGICTVDIVKDGLVWTMNVAGTKDGFTRAVRLIFDYVAGPPGIITLSSWLEQ